MGDEAEAKVRQGLQDDLPVSRGECKGALSCGDGLSMCTPVVEME